MPAFTDPPKPLPPPNIKEVSAGLRLISPLSRDGYGPGLIVVVDDIAAGARIENGIPSPAMKWAEEGYTVVELRSEAWKQATNPIHTSVEEIQKSRNLGGNNKVGIVCYSTSQWPSIVELDGNLELPEQVVAAVVYKDSSLKKRNDTTIKQLHHHAGSADSSPEDKAAEKSYRYEDQKSAQFATPFTEHFNYAAEAVSHTRNLTFLKKLMNGPYFDLETIWDEHTYYEFEARDVEATMNTMVAEPYVNHVPTLTGGIGRKALTDFYTNHFVFSNPEGTALELISRTVGIDRVVDEFIFKLNHNRQVDWLLPGVPPTNKDLAIPFMAVVNVRGDRLYHEHITWDQATALRQAGILPDSISWNNAGSSVELKLPVAGVEAVEKMRDKNSVASNAMMAYKPKQL